MWRGVKEGYVRREKRMERGRKVQGDMMERERGQVKRGKAREEEGKGRGRRHSR